MKRYPLIELMAARGRRIAIGIGLLVALVGILRAGWERDAGLLAWFLLSAAICYIGVRLLAELIEVIADTLLPR